MKARGRPCFVCLFTVLFFLISIPANAGVPEVSHVMVTDVTCVSFSVIWAASEASYANLEVYEDEAGTIAVTEADITAHPINSGNLTIAEAAQDNGVMKVRVTGLSADTTYYFKTLTTSKSTSDTTEFPVSSPFMSVTTQYETVRTKDSSGDIVPFSNDVIIEECYMEDGVNPAEGTLLIATITGANYPLTSFVGDGVELPFALIDLNNAFDRESKENIDFEAGENLTLINFRGILGNSIVHNKLPIDNSFAELKSADIKLGIGWNMVSFQLEPNDPDTLAVLDPIIDQVESIYAYDSLQNQWVFFEKYGWPFLNTLNNLHGYTGYYLFMEDVADLKIQGSLESPDIPLRAGIANLVAYRSIEALPLMDAVSEIYEYLDSIWTFENGEWVFYDKHGWIFLNTLEYVEPGKSYWIFVSSDCTW